MTVVDLSVRRVRHPLKARLLRVARTRQMSSALVGITLVGELEDFVTASFDDHVKAFFPVGGEGKPALPSFGPEGLVFQEGHARPIARDYTARRFDRAAQELDLELALNGDGPASRWAALVSPGQYLGIAGPRGSLVIPEGYDYHFLIGDETALPAIARRLEEFGPSARAFALIEVADASAKVALRTQAHVEVRWLVREGELEGSLLVPALSALTWPSGEGFVWAAGESSAMRAVRHHVLAERGVDRSRARISAYWRRGQSAVHETLDG